jgi:hypothetical protein
MIIEDEAFSLSYDLAPPPSLPHTLPSASCLSFSVFLYIGGRAYLLTGEGGGGVEEDPKHANPRKPGPL